MRVLLLDHFPLDASPSGRHVRALARALLEAGHEPRVLTASFGVEEPEEPFAVRTVQCGGGQGPDGLAFDLPAFAPARGGVSFLDLTVEQIAAYREAFRRRLDLEIADFDPQMIHAQYVWLGGQLALESGAPYVLTAWGPEFDCAAADPRYQPLVDQAAENAGRILAVDEALVVRLGARFEGAADRILCAGPRLVERTAGHELPALYRTVLEERFGV